MDAVFANTPLILLSDVHSFYIYLGSLLSSNIYPFSNVRKVVIIWSLRSAPMSNALYTVLSH